MYGAELMQAFREFKAIWDPQQRMNPGKKIEPYPMDEDLRSGPDRHPPLLKTQFAYPDDHQSFNHAVTRCVGVGNCRNHSGGVMRSEERSVGKECVRTFRYRRSRSHEKKHTKTKIVK